MARGTCDPKQGDPKFVETNSPDAKVEFSNIRYGDIDSTYGPGGGKTGNVDDLKTATSLAAVNTTTGTPEPPPATAKVLKVQTPSTTKPKL